MKECTANCFNGILLCSVDDGEGLRTVVMKCDACEQFKSDDAAAKALNNFLVALSLGLKKLEGWKQ